MDQRRFVVFMVLSIAILIGNGLLWSWLRGKAPPQVAQQNQNVADGKKDAAVRPAEKLKAAENGKEENKQPAERDADAAVAEAPEQPRIPVQRFSLGSGDPNQSTYQLLVTLTNEGAAVERAELSSARYRDLEHRGGYLGHLAPEDAPGGVRINVVGPGTPAAKEGLQAGDTLTELDKTPLASADIFANVLAKTRPGQRISITFVRAGQTQTVFAELGRYPLEIVRPEVLPEGKQIPQTVGGAAEKHDPYSFLFTLAQIDGDKLDSEKFDKQKPDQAKNVVDPRLAAELAGVKLRTAHWNGKQIDGDTVEFTQALPKFGLEVVKRFRIANAKDEPSKPAFHLTLEVEVRNVGSTPRQVAYQLDGPTGLPIEGWWYASRISPEWSGAGVRDTVLMMQGNPATMMSPMQIGDKKVDPPFRTEDPESLLVYAGVDAQYFACAIMPLPQQHREKWLAQIKPILVGEMPKERAFQTLGNVSCRLVSFPERLEPGANLQQSFTVFAGPKRPELLAQYPFDAAPGGNLGDLIYYGWPIWAVVARLMTHILTFFYSIVGNYGIAIVLLTVLVRGCMFPLSRKQAMGAQKMQALKPELDRINEKYKGKSEEKARAMQELYRKHGFNPMSGCLLALMQLPIFIGLYRSLMINVELRQAPLLGDAIRWASNLAAPDMLARWADWPFMPSFLTAYKGFLSLGPYLNILPIFTVGLFIVQQQMFMPPATDEQTRMQQKMMKYMMVFIGYAFYSVPSGLCLYIIASSLWGIAEKKLLPKPAGKDGVVTTAAVARSTASADGNGAAKRNRKKQRGR